MVRHRANKAGRLEKVGKPAVLTVTNARDLETPPMRAIDWQDGGSQVFGTRPGGYDRQKDIRLPDRAALLDVFTGAFSWEGEIGDVHGWAAANELRRKQPGRSLFAVFSPDARTLVVIDRLGRQAPLTLSVPLRLYDPTTLQEQEDDPSTLVFGLAIDPLNPDALSRRKKDPSFLDLYVVNVTTEPGAASVAAGGALPIALRRLVRVSQDDRPAAWQVRGRYAAVLRKHKSFSRGGGQLELYALD